LAFSGLATTPPQAAEAQPMANDTVLEALSAQWRCLVCQNQSLADSHAWLALDVKNQVREQLRGGRMRGAGGRLRDATLRSF
jgi:cytochrome c-type biogenesis protein CcmH/NrfF